MIYHQFMAGCLTTYIDSSFRITRYLRRNVSALRPSSAKESSTLHTSIIAFAM